MNGEIFLDEKFESGYEGFPGSRFVIDLNCTPLQVPSIRRRPSVAFSCVSLRGTELKDPSLDMKERCPLVSSINPICREPTVNAEAKQQDAKPPENSFTSSLPPLPDALSVLVVDDELVQRKLVSRSLKRIKPTWTVNATPSGEAAVAFVEENGNPTLDLIFMDQYLESTDEVHMLGSECVAKLRTMGVHCAICGLSANDTESEFMKAGAGT